MDTTELCGANNGRGYNQTTASGYPFWSLDPRPEDIRIEDIAAHLSRICRFGGALKEKAFNAAGSYEFIEIYSVAQHSVLVSQRVPQEFALEALLHDAAEAYVGDMVKPVKASLTPHWGDVWKLCLYGTSLAPADVEKFYGALTKVIPTYDKVEAKIDAVIRAKYGLPAKMSEAVKTADYEAVLTEHRDLHIDRGLVDWGVAKREPWPERIVPVLPSAARKMFLDRFDELYKGA